MKKIILFISLALIGQAAFAQDSKKKKKKAKTQTETNSQGSSGRQMASTMLTIHFISKGAGIDHTAHDKVVAYVNNNPKKPAFEETQQGREGEKKMTFTLIELNAEEQTAFVQGLQNLVGGNDRVIIDSKIKSNKVVAAPSQTLSANPLASVEGVKARVVVSFISKGAGVDRKGFEDVTSYIDGYPKKPVYEVHNWGREGEKDYVLTLNELSPEEQATFVDGLKKLISSTDMVQIRENENYVKKGR